MILEPLHKPECFGDLQGTVDPTIERILINGHSIPHTGCGRMYGMCVAKEGNQLTWWRGRYLAYYQHRIVAYIYLNSADGGKSNPPRSNIQNKFSWIKN
jgi:hypothetical protein